MSPENILHRQESIAFNETLATPKTINMMKNLLTKILQEKTMQQNKREISATDIKLYLDNILPNLGYEYYGSVQKT
jgi:phenylalanyl-tRNA synthetase beta subunit